MSFCLTVMDGGIWNDEDATRKRRRGCNMTGVIHKSALTSPLETVFQPIFETKGGERVLHAVESLTRGPRGSALEQAPMLFNYVRRRHLEPEVDRLCIAQALRDGLIGIAHARSIDANRDDSMHAIYEYLTSNDFNRRVRAMVDNRHDEKTPNRNLTGEELRDVFSPLLTDVRARLLELAGGDAAFTGRCAESSQRS